MFEEPPDALLYKSQRHRQSANSVSMLTGYYILAKTNTVLKQLRVQKDSMKAVILSKKLLF